MIRVRQLVFSLALLVGCSSEPAAPTPGMLDVRLTTPADDDGAILFTVSGGPVDSVEASGFRVHWSRIDANTVRVIVLGNLRSGNLARIYIPDERLVSHYAPAIDQVAARSYVLREPAAYALQLAP